MARRLLRGLLAAAIAGGLAGCDGSPPQGPSRFPLAGLRGVLTAAGRPIGPGWITLTPVPKTIGDHIVIRVDERGEFQTDGAARGDLQIRVRLPRGLQAELEDLGAIAPQQLREAAGIASPLRCTSGSSDAFATIDLKNLSVAQR